MSSPRAKSSQFRMLENPIGMSPCASSMRKLNRHVFFESPSPQSIKLNTGRRHSTTPGRNIITPLRALRRRSLEPMTPRTLQLDSDTVCSVGRNTCCECKDCTCLVNREAKDSETLCGTGKDEVFDMVELASPSTLLPGRSPERSSTESTSNSNNITIEIPLAGRQVGCGSHDPRPPRSESSTVLISLNTILNGETRKKDPRVQHRSSQQTQSQCASCDRYGSHGSGIENSDHLWESSPCFSAATPNATCPMTPMPSFNTDEEDEPVRLADTQIDTTSACSFGLVRRRKFFVAQENIDVKRARLSDDLSPVARGFLQQRSGTGVVTCSSARSAPPSARTPSASPPRYQERPADRFEETRHRVDYSCWDVNGLRAELGVTGTNIVVDWVKEDLISALRGLSDRLNE